MAPVAARLTNKSLRHGCRQVPDYMIMTRHIVIQYVNAFGCFDLSLKHDAVAIETCIHNDLLFYEMVLKPLEFWVTTTIIYIETSRLE
jgi:hypothetical protein